MESANSLIESSLKSLRGWNGQGTIRVTGIRCTTSPAGFAGTDAAALTGAETGGVVVVAGVLPGEPPINATNPRTKAGFGMGGEWRTPTGLSKSSNSCAPRAFAVALEPTVWKQYAASMNY